jgi:hypothetical protein
MSSSPVLSVENNEKGSFVEHVQVQHRMLESAPDDVIINRFGFLGPFLSRLFAIGVEARGVERVPEDQRETKNTWNKCVALCGMLYCRMLITVPAKQACLCGGMS